MKLLDLLTCLLFGHDWSESPTHPRGTTANRFCHRCGAHGFNIR